MTNSERTSNRATVRGKDLRNLCDELLTQQVLPPSMRISIDRLLEAGESQSEIVRRVTAAAGGRRRLIVLAVEAYLGLDQSGTVAGDPGQPPLPSGNNEGS